MQADTPPVCDYEGSDYRTRFWEGQGRSYEDQVERIALRRLMPATGSTLLEIGAGYGRLADEYRGYERVVLFDYSRSLLREAQGHLKNDPRFLFVAGNWYKMPFVAGLFETLVQIRTIHHAADVPALMAQLARIARPHGQYILEFANKKNLKAIFRYLLRRQNWSPFTPEPIEFATLNFDFQTNWIRQQLSQAGFKPGQMLTTSHYRIPLLKKIIPMSLLVQLDSLAQWTGNWWQLSPSVFVYNQHPQTSAAAVPDQFIVGLECEISLAESSTDRLLCTGCGRAWAIRDGLYDFKEPVNPSD